MTAQVPTRKKPRLAVWKFSSCDGCQLTLLDCEDELLAVAGAVEIAYFLEATRARIDGPYDVSLVEGSVTTAEEKERILDVRRQSGVLIAIGACATAGGIQALKNFTSVDGLIRAVYAHPEYIATLSTSTPIRDHVKVDFELRGCPISKAQLLEVVSALLNGRKPALVNAGLCLECKRKGIVCVMVAGGEPCLGPVTQAGCGSVCPASGRGCFGCFGPKEGPNAPALSRRLTELGLERSAIRDLYRGFSGSAEAFREESKAHD
ncbi:MAG: oxidoreductase [Alphaproteobacteria bacterium]|nr:oxidoreductase [Alphaproteobacteria bacterium]MBF0130812.1 oxidoreductase [Alphaproteobacteria bacterium]